MRLNRLYRLLRLPGCSPALLAAALPSRAGADYSASFATQVAGIGHESLPVHGYFLAILAVLFVALFGIMVYTMARHGKRGSDHLEKVAGSSGAVQWLWVMVPFAILLFVDYVLIRLHFTS
ncbi:MAG TPA: hypothetical protein DHV85_21725 [Candidatus Accumulibacter sp.]|nr:hypothetical protein [Accumulibacter sp.]